MIMSVHDPLSRKRDMPENMPDLKRSRAENSDFSDKMYSVYVKSAIEAMEKVCHNKGDKKRDGSSRFISRYDS